MATLAFTCGVVRMLSLCVVLSVGIFVVLIILAMKNYPGGTWFDRSARGHQFWFNFYCDLLRPVALNGLPNPVASRAALAGMLTLALGLLSLWLVFPTLLSAHARLGRAVRMLGVANALALLSLPLTVSKRFGVWHDDVIIVAGIPGFIAAALGILGLVAEHQTPRWLIVLSSAMWCSSVLDFVTFAYYFSEHELGSKLLPLWQKVASMLFLAWMVAIAARARRVTDPKTVSVRGGNQRSSAQVASSVPCADHRSCQQYCQSDDGLGQ